MSKGFIIKHNCTVNVKSKTEPEKDEVDEKEDTEIAENELCGCKINCCGRKARTRCSVCQPLATVKWAIFLFCIGNILMQMVKNGLISVNTSTIEKRFELRSTESGMIASSLEFFQALAMLAMLMITENVHKPRWISWGLVLTGIGILLMAVPHFTAPPYTFVDAEMFNFCNNVTEPNCSESMLRNYRYWFMFAISLIGIGACPLYAYAVTFIDENTDKGNSAFYNAIYYAVGGLGSAIAFILGGLALELYTDIGTSSEDLTIDSSSYVWVGAWWLGYIFTGIFTLLIAIPVFQLPKHLPGTSEHRRNRDSEAQKSHLEMNEEELKSGPRRAFSEVILLLKNKPFVFTTLGLATNCGLIFGWTTFGAKYLESVFGMTAFHAALLFGISAIFASGGAQVTGGLLIKKLKLDTLGIIKMIIICGLISAACSFGFIIHCQNIDFVGGIVPYPNTTFTMSPYSSCNMDCDCSTDRYEPVCGEDDSIYFSPCFAGCNVQINETAFANCSCIGNTTSNPVLSTEICNTRTCSLLYPFMGVLFFCFFTSVITLTPSMQVTMRCVPFNKRVTALSLQSACARLFGSIPGRIIVGMVLDLSCVAWGTECGERGSCKAYERENVSRNNMILLLCQTVVCAIFFCLVWVTYKPAGDPGEKNQQNEVLNEIPASEKESMPLTTESYEKDDLSV